MRGWQCSAKPAPAKAGGGDDAAREHQALEHLQRGPDCVAAGGAVRRDRPPRLGIPYADHQRRHVGTAALVAVPQALGVDGDHPLRRAQTKRSAQGLGKAGQSGLQFGRIEQAEDAAETVVARGAMRQIDNLSQGGFMAIGKIGDIDYVFRPAQCCRQRDEQHRGQRMSGIDIARVTDLAKNRDDCFGHRGLDQKRVYSYGNFF